MGWHRIRDAEGNLHSLDDEQYALYLENQRKQKRMGCILKVIGVIVVIILFAIFAGANGDDNKKTQSKPNNETVSSERENMIEENDAKINTLMNTQPEVDVKDQADNQGHDNLETQENNTLSQEIPQDNTADNVAPNPDDYELSETQQVDENKSQKELEKEVKRRAKEEAKAAKRKAKEEAKEVKRRAKEEAKRAAEIEE